MSFVFNTESGRLGDALGGKAFAVIGRRGQPSGEDRARAKLLFEVSCLRQLVPITTSTSVKYGQQNPVPSDWSGVDFNDTYWGGYGKSRTYESNGTACSYWGPALFRQGEDAQGAPKWT